MMDMFSFAEIERSMTDFNPLSGAILGSAQAQHQVAVSKQRQLRRTQAMRKDSAATGDQTEHQVESSEDVVEIHDENARQDQRRHQPTPPKPPQKKLDDDLPHLDLTI